MLASEALDIISKKYIAGAGDFFSKMNPDPWTAAHERFEADLLMLGSDRFGTKAKDCALQFVSACESLLEMYSKLKGLDKKISVKDSFYISENLALRTSFEEKKCLSCESVTDLKIAKHKGVAALLCPGCRG